MSGILKVSSVQKELINRTAGSTAFREVEQALNVDISEGMYPRLLSVDITESQPLSPDAAVTSAQNNIVGINRWQIGGTTQADFSEANEFAAEDVFFHCGRQSNIVMPAAASIGMTSQVFGDGSREPFRRIFNPGVVVGAASVFLRDQEIDADTIFTNFAFQVALLYDVVQLDDRLAATLRNTGRIL